MRYLQILMGKSTQIWIIALLPIVVLNAKQGKKITIDLIENKVMLFWEKKTFFVNGAFPT